MRKKNQSRPRVLALGGSKGSPAGRTAAVVSNPESMPACISPGPVAEIGTGTNSVLSFGADIDTRTKRSDEMAFRRWGDDNLFPEVLARLSRLSTTHRRIINDKADYISGKGFSFDGVGHGSGNGASHGANNGIGNLTGDTLGRLVERANGDGESLRQVLNKLAFDKALFGNAFLEVVTDPGHTFLSLHHHDASVCRVAREGRAVILHHDWSQFRPSEAKRVPLYPDFELCADGLLHSMVHYKDYEPMFRHYGLPSYIAGMNVSAIAYKTDKWNISRLDNSFQFSGMMVIDAATHSEAEAEHVIDVAEAKFSGKPGQVLYLVKNHMGKEDHSRFIPINSNNEGDWKALHDQATSDIVVAHSWFRSLSGLDYGAGFNAERILHEYEIALNTVILAEQSELLDPIRRIVELVLGVDASSLQVVNRPPTRSKPLYMKVWEARKADGLEYDPTDDAQQLYLGQIVRYNMTHIE